jgi:predicted nucleic acid-binding Zn ribbon protein
MVCSFSMNIPGLNRKKGPPRRDARQSILAAWRGTDLAPEETARAITARSARDLMGPVLRKLNLDQKQAEAEVQKVWKHLIDPNIVAHAQPTGIHKGTLFVTVDSSVWLDEIVRYRRKEILDRLQHSFGKDVIKRISFRAG